MNEMVTWEGRVTQICCCKVAVIFLAWCATVGFIFCSNDCFPAERAIYSVDGVGCSGRFRIHNSKGGGSSPTPATNFLNKFKDLQQTRKSRLARVVVKLL